MAAIQSGSLQAGLGLQDETQGLVANLLDGMLRKHLGLSREQLRVGLTVAHNHLDRGAYGDAFRIYAALVLCEPTDVDFQVGLANCASLLGEHPLALQAASAVVELEPTDPRGHLLSGRSCIMMGNLITGREHLNEALHYARISTNEPIAKEAEFLLERHCVAAQS